MICIHITVQKDWQMTKTTFVKYFFNNAKVLPVIIPFKHYDAHVVGTYHVLSFGLCSLLSIFPLPMSIVTLPAHHLWLAPTHQPQLTALQACQGIFEECLKKKKLFLRRQCQSIILVEIRHITFFWKYLERKTILIVSFSFFCFLFCLLTAG